MSEARAILNEHYAYLSDEVRLDAYRRALQRVVTPSSVVLDLGCGTGVLGWLACQAGAKRVYAVDRTGLIEVAREIALENGCADRIVHVRQSSREAKLPEQADIVVADQMGPFGFDAGMAGDFADASARLLKPGGVLVPGEVVTWCAPADAAAAYGVVDRWGAVAAGLRTGAVRRRAANVPILARHDVSLLAEPAAFFAFRQGDGSPPDVTRPTLTWAITHNGTLHGLLCWFVATLAPGIRVTNGPSDAPRLRRSSALLPLEEPVGVREGDVVRAEVIAGMPKRFFVWRVSVRRGNETLLAVEQATLRGRLLSAEDLDTDGAQTS